MSDTPTAPTPPAAPAPAPRFVVVLAPIESEGEALAVGRVVPLARVAGAPATAHRPATPDDLKIAAIG